MANPGWRDGKLKVSGMTANPRPIRRQAQGDVMQQQIQGRHDGKCKTTRRDGLTRRQALGQRDGKP